METKTTLNELQETRTKNREAQLHSMGFSKKMFGFGFQNFFVNNYQIEFLDDLYWDHFIEYTLKSQNTIKEKLSVKVSDKQKIETLIIQLSDITGPEVAAKTPRELVELVTGTLKDLSEFLTVELKKLPDESTTSN